MQKQTIQRILVYVNSEVAKYQFLVTYFSPLISKNSCARLHVCRDLDSKSNPKKAFSKVCSDIIHKKRKGNSVDACARQGGTCTASSCMKSVEPTLPSLTFAYFSLLSIYHCLGLLALRLSAISLSPDLAQQQGSGVLVSCCPSHMGHFHLRINLRKTIRHFLAGRISQMRTACEPTAFH